MSRIAAIQKAIGRRAKEIAQENGYDSDRCEAAEDAALNLAEDVEDLAPRELVQHLVNLMRKLSSMRSETWQKIKEDATKWRPWDPWID